MTNLHDKKPVDPNDTVRTTAPEMLRVDGIDTNPSVEKPLSSTSEHVSLFFNLIHGQEKAAASNQTFEDHSPSAPEQAIGTYPRSDVQDARRAVDSAASAYEPWRRTNIHRRAELLNKFASLIEVQHKQLARAIVIDTGKTISEADQEVRAAAVILRNIAGLALQPEGSVYNSNSTTRLALTRRQSLGVVVVITPFNFPLAMPVWKCGPALLAGNTVVLKPSELAPYPAALLGMLSQQAGMPPGVFNILHGSGDDLGDELCNNPSVAALSFTGRPLGARKIGGACGRAGKRFQVETAGKNPVIVLADADLELAADLTVEGAFRFAGQKCLATSRVLVQARVYDQFLDLLKLRLPRLAVGDPLDPRTYMGPLIDGDALQRVKRAEKEAIAEGAHHLVEPLPVPNDLRRGHFLAPRILVDVPATSAATRTELFGPLLSTFRFDTVEEAVALANATPYGLTASVMTRNIRTALEMSDGLDVGTVRINGATTGIEPHIPMSAGKESGTNSVSFGREALDFFSQLQTVYMDYA